MAQRLSNAELARQTVARFPRHSQRSIARVLCAEHPNRFTGETALSCVKKVANGRSRTKKAEGYERHKDGLWNPPPPIPASLAKEWEPVQLCEKAERVLVLSDIHVPYHDDAALEGALKVGDKYKPTVVFINGDLCDFYAISRWETDPDKRDFRSEIESIRAFIAHIRSRSVSYTHLTLPTNREV